ncbi:uncharacterized protein VTP21DRAFT_3516 [Calcarisporiella thermophila]|uniref:uncharacterized protein n=1 Tax=Calcarisporiella thermophila TaxID=911321 RepID=UPI0037444FAF
MFFITIFAQEQNRVNQVRLQPPLLSIPARLRLFSFSPLLRPRLTLHSATPEAASASSASGQRTARLPQSRGGLLFLRSIALVSRLGGACGRKGPDVSAT